MIVYNENVGTGHMEERKNIGRFRKHDRGIVFYTDARVLGDMGGVCLFERERGYLVGVVIFPFFFTQNENEQPSYQWAIE